jgi:hypothetical protein
LERVTNYMTINALPYLNALISIVFPKGYKFLTHKEPGSPPHNFSAYYFTKTHTDQALRIGHTHLLNAHELKNIFCPFLFLPHVLHY